MLHCSVSLVTSGRLELWNGTESVQKLVIANFVRLVCLQILVMYQPVHVMHTLADSMFGGQGGHT